MEVVESRPESEATEDAFELWEDSRYSWLFFMSLCRLGQWAYAGGGMQAARRSGIPADRILATMKGLGIPKAKRLELFRDTEAIVGEILYADMKVRELKQQKKD